MLFICRYLVLVPEGPSGNNVENNKRCWVLNDKATARAPEKEDEGEGENIDGESEPHAMPQDDDSTDDDPRNANH